MKIPNSLYSLFQDFKPVMTITERLVLYGPSVNIEILVTMVVVWINQDNGLVVLEELQSMERLEEVLAAIDLASLEDPDDLSSEFEQDALLAAQFLGSKGSQSTGVYCG